MAAIARGNNGLGFLFFYELMTERLSLRVLPADSPYNWGSLLLRFVNVDDLKSKDVILSLLRILVNNGNMKADFPCFEDTRTFKLSMMFRGSSTLQQLLKAPKILSRSILTISNGQEK